MNRHLRFIRHILAASVGAIGCNSPVRVCTDEGPRYEVSPSDIELAIGAAAQVSVTEVTCSGRRQVPVYPELAILDTNIASVNTFYRQVVGRSVGSTTLQVVVDADWPPLAAAVVVR